MDGWADNGWVSGWMEMPKNSGQGTREVFGKG